MSPSMHVVTLTESDQSQLQHGNTEGVVYNTLQQNKQTNKILEQVTILVTLPVYDPEILGVHPLAF